MRPLTSLRSPIVALFMFTLMMPATSGMADGRPQESRDQQGRGERPDPCEQLSQSNGNATGLHRRCDALGTGGGAARGDFNGDGFADLAIGVPYEDVAGVDATGAVQVLYGSSTGLRATPLTITAPDDQIFDITTVGREYGAGDHFGWSLAAGDFNGDTYSDLAIGAPDRDIHGRGSDDGVVFVIYGSSVGLDTETVDTAPTSLNVGGREGAALVWADFNNDSFADLAIGSPNATVRGDAPFCADIDFKVANAGKVEVLYGSPGGLSSFGKQILKQGTCNYASAEAGVGYDSPEEHDRFGAALAALPRASGGADLVIGAPLEDLALFDKRDAGVVHVIRGGGSLSTNAANNQLLSQDTPGVGGGAESGDQFGRVLATGNFSGDREAIVVGIPFEDLIDNTRRDGGAIQVFFRNQAASFDLVSTSDSLFISQSNLSGVSVETGDLMGWALASGDFDGDGRDDLAVGSPGEDVSAIVDAGMVSILYGSSSGPSTARIQHWHQDSTGILDFAEGGDQFGYALSSWNYGMGSQRDLAIGVPFEEVQSATTGSNQIDAGAVHVIYGSRTGLSATGNQLWTQETSGVKDVAERDDRFGSALY